LALQKRAAQPQRQKGRSIDWRTTVVQYASWRQLDAFTTSIKKGEKVMLHLFDVLDEIGLRPEP